MLKSKISITRISIIALILTLAITAAYAADSYSLINNHVVFSLSSNDGIYHTATIFKGPEKIIDLELCNKDKCLGKITSTMNITNLAGEYTLGYWVYDNYQRKTLNFTINSNDQINTNQNSQTSSQQNNLASQKNPLIKTLIVTTICRLSSLVKGSYQDCRDKYL